MKGCGCDHIDPAAQQVLKVHEEAAQSESRFAWFHFDKKIDVAGWASLVFGHRSKELNALCSPPSCQLKDGLTMRFNKRVHSSISGTMTVRCR
jgi:hypothetical protein